MRPSAPSEAAAGLAVVCVCCGYDLTGLPGAGVCPECALPIAKSLARSSLLRGADPAWLARTHRGLSLTAAAMRVFLWMILAALGAFGLVLLLGSLGVDFGDVVGSTVVLLIYVRALLAATIFHLRGTWLLTGNTFGGYAPSLYARIAARWAGALLPFCAGYGLLLGDAVGVMPRAARLAVAAGCQVVATACLVGLARCLEGLGRRTSGWSPEHARRYRNVRKNIYGVLILAALMYLMGPGPGRGRGDWGIALFGLAYMLMGSAVARVRDAVALELAIERNAAP